MNVIAAKPMMQITKISEHIGAEVTGIDLRQPVDEETRRRLNAAVVEHIALVIRDQDFTPEQFVAATALFGEPMDQDTPQYAVPGAPLLRKVSNRNIGKDGKPAKKGGSWHTDHTNHVIPPKYTCLYAMELPSSGGGTSVANMRAAYAALPEDLKQRMDGLQTANVRLGSAVKKFGTTAAEEQARLKPVPVMQPLVRTNPDNGSKAVYFHANKTENITGMSPEDSQAFLHDLLARVLRPEFIYVHQWRMGDMLLWDNRSSMHKAGGDYDSSEHRLLYRSLVKGEMPF